MNSFQEIDRYSEMNVKRERGVKLCSHGLSNIRLKIIFHWLKSITWLSVSVLPSSDKKLHYYLPTSITRNQAFGKMYFAVRVVQQKNKIKHYNKIKTHARDYDKTFNIKNISLFVISDILQESVNSQKPMDRKLVTAAQSCPFFGFENKKTVINSQVKYSQSSI